MLNRYERSHHAWRLSMAPLILLHSTGAVSWKGSNSDGGPVHITGRGSTHKWSSWQLFSASDVWDRGHKQDIYRAAGGGGGGGGWASWPLLANGIQAVRRASLRVGSSTEPWVVPPQPQYTKVTNDSTHSGFAHSFCANLLIGWQEVSWADAPTLRVALLMTYVH